MTPIGLSCDVPARSATNASPAIAATTPATVSLPGR
jgi:hypothetical protein